VATLSQAEQRGAVDGIFRFAGEDYQLAGAVLAYLKTVLAAFTWDAQLRTRAALWQPYITSGLSITWWCDETIRYSNIYLGQ